MTTRQTLFAGSVVGFGISCAVLALLWFGVAGVLRGGRIDLMYVFWPSSVMLVRGWCCTVPGIMITASSVVIQLLAVHGTCICYVAGCAARSHIVGVINRRSHNFAPFFFAHRAIRNGPAGSEAKRHTGNLAPEPEVKSYSTIDRFFVGFHSPTGRAGKLGLCIAGTKTAHNVLSPLLPLRPVPRRP